MKKKFGKILSILLTAVMLVGMLPATAFANGRKEISKVVAVSEGGNITPEYGEQVTNPVFATIEGIPAYLDCNNWQKKVGDDWVDMASGDTFIGGTYRYMAQLRIDSTKIGGYDGTTHKLSKTSITVTVDGIKWDVHSTANVYENVSFVRVYSQEFTVATPEGLELTFYDSKAFDIARSYVGKAITSKNVAGNVEGGTKPYTFSKASGPDWINVAEDGKITGTPDVAGTNEELVVKVTDSVGDYKTITINVSSTKINPADRTVISVVEATSDINPKYGEKAVKPTITTTVGKPAYLYGYNWQKKVDGQWKNMSNNDIFEEGTYRYVAQLRIDETEFDGYDKTTHKLSKDKDSLTVIVDGKAWEVNSNATVSDDSPYVSFVAVDSPEFTVTKPVIMAIKINGITTPVAGKTAKTNGIMTENPGITLDDPYWNKMVRDKMGRESLVKLGESERFELNKTYYLVIPYVVSDYYTVSGDAKILHNLTDGKATHNSSVKTIIIEYKVSETHAVTNAVSVSMVDGTAVGVNVNNAETADIMVALYDENGKMLAYKSCKGIEPGNSNYQLIELAEMKTGQMVKAFIVKAGTYEPLAKASEYIVAE